MENGPGFVLEENFLLDFDVDFKFRFGNRKIEGSNEKILKWRLRDWWTNKEKRLENTHAEISAFKKWVDGNKTVDFKSMKVRHIYIF